MKTITTHEFSYADLEALADGQPEPLTRVADDVIDQTRWGYITRYVFTSPDVEGFWAFDCEYSSGDGDYTTFDDYDKGSEIPCRRVYPHTVTTTTYKESQ